MVVTADRLDRVIASLDRLVRFLSRRERLPPWDASSWFDLPAERTIDVGATASVVSPNRQRVGLLFFAAVNTVAVSTSPNVSSVAPLVGYQLSSSSLPFRLSHSELGPLVQLEWFAQAGLAGSRLVIAEIVLRDWPRSA